MDPLHLALCALGGYLAGSIPTGVLLGRLAGKDPRSAGSGNIGASNVTRTLGKKLGALTLVVDVLKGWLPTLAAAHLLPAESALTGALIAGFAAVVGHCFPIWLKFAGGKGVATSFGAVAGVMPMVGIIAALVWAGLVFFTRIPTIGSLIAATLFVGLAYVESHPFEVHLFTLALFALIVVRHASNLRVLRDRWSKKPTKKAYKRPPRPAHRQPTPKGTRPRTPGAKAEKGRRKR